MKSAKPTRFTRLVSAAEELFVETESKHNFKSISSLAIESVGYIDFK